MSARRWKPHERYGQLQFPTDKRGDAPKLIRQIYSEPPGYHQGVVVKGAPALNARMRALRKKEISKAQKRLSSFRGVSA